ncbi:MAG: argininosuccinate lyase [Thermomicrobiales bacterium]|nr:argininosuccinate lyase [Thermomicrobiales bacterium]
MNGSAPESRAQQRTLWDYVGQTVAAHVVMLFDAGLIDDDARSRLLAVIDAVSAAQPPEATLAGLVADFDNRLDAQTPAGVSGTSRVGRGTADTVATVSRLALRDSVLELGDALDAARRASLDLAAANVTTLMPAYVGGQPAQPTNFGHFLGGLIGPLGRTAARMTGVYAEVNRSPLGAAALASTGLGIERERAAELLGFDGPIVNTLDAVAAVDHAVAIADLTSGMAIAVRRFIVELRTWLRTEPDSFRLAESWTTAVPDLPQLRVPTRLEALLAGTRAIEADAQALRSAVADLPYGPIAWCIDEVLTRVFAAVERCITVLKETAVLLGNDLETNRAYLANRAGRGHTTSSDLADFLMIEEQLDPGTAQSIAARVTARIIGEGIDVSGITPEIIDAAALMVIGRELKVEFESISRYLAPRRFLERRTATGAPSPAATRAYLDQEALRLGTDQRRRTGARERLSASAASLQAAIDEALARSVAD